LATFDFRILLETVEGNKFSYASSSFVDTSIEPVLSASQVYNRITGSHSCSFENQTTFTGTTLTSSTFNQNTLISASLTGSYDTGSIIFTALDTEYDRLLRYKFVGDKVCNVLGLVNDQWLYVDQFRLPSDDESNFFEGNLRAKNVIVSDNMVLSSTSNVNSDIPFLIDTGSDRYIKFIDTRDVPQAFFKMGYDNDEDTYEISNEGNTKFNIDGVHVISGGLINLGGDKATTNKSLKLAGLTEVINIPPSSYPIFRLTEDDDTTTDSYAEINQHLGRLTIWNRYSNTDEVSNFGDVRIRTQLMSNAIYIDNATQRVGIGTSSPDETLHVAGDFKVDGGITATSITSSNITSSTIITSGSNIFGDEIGDTQTFNGHITASNNISASGFISASVFGPVSSSGDIMSTAYKLKSPSGGDEISVLTTSGDDINVGDTGMDDVLALYGQLSYIKIDDGNFAFNTNSPTSKVHFDNADMFVGSHITASENISASGHVTSSGLHLPDDGKITLGGIGDLQIYHDGSDSYIEDSGTGNLILQSSKVQFKNAAGSETMLSATEDGAVSINFDNSAKLVTSADGITVGGNVFVLSEITASGDIHANGNIVGDNSTNISGINNITASTDISSSLASTGSFGTLHLEGTNFSSASLAGAIAGGGGSTNAAGSDTQVQFNDGGTNFGGDAGLVYNQTTNILTAGAMTSSGGITAGGNISASGDSHTFGGTLTVEDNTPIIKLIDKDGGGNDMRIQGLGYTMNIKNNQNHGSADLYLGVYNMSYGVYLDKSAGSVGIGTNTPDSNTQMDINGALQVQGNITASGDIRNTKTLQMTNSSSAIDTFNTGSFRSAKYTLQVTSASNYQVSEMLVLHNDGTTLNTEYAQLNSGVNLVDFSTKVGGSDARLIASSSFISCSVKYERVIIPK